MCNITITTIQNLISDMNQVVVFQHMYYLNGEFMECSSKTLASSAFNSDFGTVFIFGTHESTRVRGFLQNLKSMSDIMETNLNPKT